MRKQIHHCYMCDEKAASREHVPPLCLFPTLEESGGVDFRCNLITVPSCATHNSAKSHDDEFLMASLAGIFGSNKVGLKHRLSKVSRAIERSSEKLLHDMFLRKEIVRVEHEPNEYLDVMWGTPDVERLNACFDRIARGLYFHSHGERFAGRTRTLLGYLHRKEASAANFAAFVREKVASELRGKPLQGQNQAVFGYQFTDRDELSLFSAVMRFYEGLDVFVAFIPERCEVPRTLAMELMNGGIKTVISLNGKQFEIN